MQKDTLFINAVCKSREKYLLGYDKLLRFLDAEDYDEALRLLKESGFGRNSNDDSSLAQIIYSEEEDLIGFIKDYAPKGGLINYFLLPYDFLNAEALLKCKKLGLSKDKLIGHEGLLSIKEITLAVEGGKCKIEEINRAIQEAEELFDNHTPTGAMIDTVFINWQYRAIKRLTKDKLGKKLMDIEVDFKNISSALRSQNKDEYYQLKIPFGTLTKSQEEVLLSKDNKKIVEKFKSTELSDFINKAVEELGNPLVNYEKLVESFSLKKLKETRFFIRGTEPFMLYVLYRKADIKNVRLVMISIFNGLDRSIIKSKLRECYGG